MCVRTLQTNAYARKLSGLILRHTPQSKSQLASDIYPARKAYNDKNHVESKTIYETRAKHGNELKAVYENLLLDSEPVFVFYFICIKNFVNIPVSDMIINTSCASTEFT